MADLTVNRSGELAKAEPTKDSVKKIEDFANFDFEPVGQRAVIYFPHLPNKSKGGVIIPDSSMDNWIKDYFDKNRYHLIVAVSPGLQNMVGTGFETIEKGDYVALDVHELSRAKFFNTPNYPKDTFYVVDIFNVQGVLVEGELEAAIKGDAETTSNPLKTRPESV